MENILDRLNLMNLTSLELADLENDGNDIRLDQTLEGLLEGICDETLDVLIKEINSPYSPYEAGKVIDTGMYFLSLPL